MASYPPVGFHFIVAFQLFPQSPGDFRFQEVSGLEMEMEMESFVEGGQNRFTWQLPKRTRYPDLMLKRGMLSGSGLIAWCRNGLENFIFDPVNVTVSLLNAEHLPIQTWYVINAIPKKWAVSSFNAEENSIVVESLTLGYQYFEVIETSFDIGF